MRAHFILLSSLSILSACTKDTAPARREPPPGNVAADPIAPDVPAPAPRTLEERVAALAEAAGAAFPAVGDQAAVHLVYGATGLSKVTASCAGDGSAFAAAVHARARLATADLRCDGNRCLHYGPDDVRTAFVFRADGTLAGVLENIETADAAGPDDEIQDMDHELAKLDCPEKDLDLAGVRLDTTSGELPDSY